MSNLPDYYQILGLAPQADKSQIKQAYKKMVRQLHPDINPSPESQERLRQVLEAYRVLSNEQIRQSYDTLRQYKSGQTSAEVNFKENLREYLERFNPLELSPEEHAEYQFFWGLTIIGAAAIVGAVFFIIFQSEDWPIALSIAGGGAFFIGLAYMSRRSIFPYWFMFILVSGLLFGVIFLIIQDSSFSGIGSLLSLTICSYTFGKLLFDRRRLLRKMSE